MVTAFGVSVAFLICYLVFHSQVGSAAYPRRVLKRFTSAFSQSHNSGASVPVLAIMTLRGRCAGIFITSPADRVVTFPIWLYVSVTGVMYISSLSF